MEKPKHIAIVGATGYTGNELLRFLLSHPHVEVTYLASRSQLGKKYSEIFPEFEGKTDLTLQALDYDHIADQCDLAFLCLPHHASIDAVVALKQRGLSIIDLSADFRIKDQSVYETWYGPHHAPELLQDFVYGLPELYRQEIKQSTLIANPGCYPTSMILSLAPLIKAKLIDLESIVCDAKSGVSGAGRESVESGLWESIQDNFRAYKIGEHRHTPETEQILSDCAKENVEITFTPHLLPIHRGMLCSSYAKVTKEIDVQEIVEVFEDFYKNEPFTKVVSKAPELKDVQGTNLCLLYPFYNPRQKRITIISVIDNLVKGASGQAIQNMNLVLSYPENTGLI